MAESDRKNGETTDGRDERGRFAPGNPGRPRGARHKATRAAEALLEGQAEALTQAAVDAALGGDVTALRLCLDRIAPAKRDAPVAFSLPELRTAEDAARAIGTILEAVGGGDLTPSEGERLAGLVESFRRTLETTEIEARLRALEEGREDDARD